MISKILRQIKKLQKQNRKNVTLDDAERDPHFDKFRIEIKKALVKQADSISTEEIERLWFEFAKLDFNLFEIPSMKDLVGLGAFMSFFKFSASVGGQAALDDMGSDDTFALTNDSVINYLRNHSLKLVKDLDQTTKKQIANLIVKGQEMSLTSFETQELIQASFKGISENRSNLIAANELNTAINYAQYETYVRSGVTRVRWVTVLDGRVCPICEPLHNQEMGINNKFVGINDNQIVYQGMYPPAHVRCRCYTEEVLEGFEVVNERIAWTGN